MGTTRSAAAARGPWVLALDVGSSSVRAQLFDAEGKALAPAPAAQVPVRWTTAPAGRMEIDPARLASAAFRALDAGVAAAQRAGVRIAAVGMDSFWHGLLGSDDAGRALTPLFGWGDARGWREAARLRREQDEAALHARTGCFLHQSYPAVRLVWLRRRGGDSFRRACWHSIGEHLGMRLFGTGRSSLSMASGTGLLDVRRCRWDDEMLRLAGVSAGQLPELSDQPLRGLLPWAAQRWPALAEVPWFPALGDGACASLGSGAAGPGKLAVTVGTSAAVRVLRDGAVRTVPAGLWLYRLDAERFVAGRALSNAGNGMAWLRRTFRLPHPARLEAALGAALDAGTPPPRLRVDPSLLAERPPRAAGPGASIRGITAATTALDVWRAWLGALAERIAGTVQAVEAEYGPASELLASGGALHASPAFRRMLEQALGRPLSAGGAGDETLRGAALHALRRLPRDG